MFRSERRNNIEILTTFRPSQRLAVRIRPVALIVAQAHRTNVIGIGDRRTQFHHDQRATFHRRLDHSDNVSFLLPRRHGIQSHRSQTRHPLGFTLTKTNKCNDITFFLCIVRRKICWKQKKKSAYPHKQLPKSLEGLYWTI